MEHPVYVYVEKTPPFGVRHVLQQTAPGNACVADEQVEGSGGLEHGAYLRGLCDIRAYRLGAELGTEAVRADVAEPAQVRAMFEAAGPFDLLVCNAGVAWSGLLQDMTDAEWRRLFDVNVNGMFHCCREAIPYMVERKRGCIICTSSILGVRGGSCETAYSATKGAVISFVKGLAKELGPSGIRVNAVAPGAIDTDMLSCFTAEDKAAMAENSALGRIGRPEDISRVVAFLASEAASFVTGQVLGADGGMII